MNIKISENFNLTLFEFVTVLYFICLAFAYWIKILVFQELNLAWVVGNLSPIYIIVFSVQILVSVTLGGIVASFIPNASAFGASFFTLLLAFVYSVVLYFFYFDLAQFFGKYKDHLINLLVLLMTTFYALNFKIHQNLAEQNILYNEKTSSKIKNNIPIGYIICVIGFFTIPSLISKFEKDKIIKRPDLFFSIVQMKDNKEKWYLIEMIGDKALLKLDSNAEKYKLVEYKDIELISTN